MHNNNKNKFKNSSFKLKVITTQLALLIACGFSLQAHAQYISDDSNNSGSFSAVNPGVSAGDARYTHHTIVSDKDRVNTNVDGSTTTTHYHTVNNINHIHVDNVSVMPVSEDAKTVTTTTVVKTSSSDDGRQNKDTVLVNNRINENQPSPVVTMGPKPIHHYKHYVKKSVHCVPTPTHIQHHVVRKSVQTTTTTVTHYTHTQRMTPAFHVEVYFEKNGQRTPYKHLDSSYSTELNSGSLSNSQYNYIREHELIQDYALFDYQGKLACNDSTLLPYNVSALITGAHDGRYTVMGKFYHVLCVNDDTFYKQTLETDFSIDGSLSSNSSNEVKIPLNEERGEYVVFKAIFD